MASACCILSEDHFLCCICLRMFTDPVSTPCGHNFCKTCLDEYWNNNDDHWKCPLCNKTFEDRPDLSVNTLISEIESQFRKSTELNSRAHEHEDKNCCEKRVDACLHLLSKLEQMNQQKAKAAKPLMGKWIIGLILLSLAFIFPMPGTMWMSFYAVDVTLDPDTAHPYLILSDDGKQVSDEYTYLDLPDDPERFNLWLFVLGKEGYSTGRFYYEVQVRGKTEWVLGVARESINRKGEINVTPQNGVWTVWLRNENIYEAGTDPPVLLSLREKPEKVGVFVDYEGGLISFYDVEARSHIYSFNGQSFTEKLYPLFSPCDNDGGKNSAPLIISGAFRTSPINNLRIFTAALLEDLTGVLH